MDRRGQPPAWVLGVTAHSRSYVIASWHPLSGWGDQAGYGIILSHWRPLAPLPEAKS